MVCAKIIPHQILAVNRDKHLVTQGHHTLNNTRVRYGGLHWGLVTMRVLAYTLTYGFGTNRKDKNLALVGELQTL